MNATCGRIVGLAGAALSLSACAALLPDRSVRSTMTLAPGQTASGRIQARDGSGGFVVFTRGDPKIAGPETPFSGSTIYPGDDAIVISFPDDPPGVPLETTFSYASHGLADGRVCRVVLRNTSNAPATFIWTVRGPSDAVADWDVSSPTN
jgi:hypothetical protein